MMTGLIIGSVIFTISLGIMLIIKEEELKNIEDSI